MKYILYLAIGSFLLMSCQNTPTSVPTSEEQISPPELSAEEKAQIKTQALLQKYPHTDGYIQLTWDTLANMDFDMRFVEELEGEVPFPIFSETMKELAGELVEIKGYVIPFEETGDEDVIFLSAFPYTQCFFCGAAGPESVVDILSKSPLGHLEMDEKMSFRGRLRLNDADLDYLNYIVDDANLVD